MGKPRGGQRKHWAEEARIWAWYAEIRRRCNWSDYALDMEFAWTEEGRGSRSTTQRPRTFEWIRKLARAPRGHEGRWRGMAELVAAVERNRLFKGTQALFKAEIWDMFQDMAPPPATVQKRIDRLLKANRLMRVPAEKALNSSEALVRKHGLPSVYDRCLLLSLGQMDRFSAVALVWSLYLQTEPAHNARFRAVVEGIADRLLDHFFFDLLPDRHLDFYDKAIGALLRSRLDLSSMGISGYGYIETVGTWLVVPEHLIGKLTEGHLMLDPLEGVPGAPLQRKSQ